MVKRLCTYILALSLLFTGCELIPEQDQLIPVPAPIGSTRRHVLLDFTGFRCVNCPEAASTAASLQALYGDQLILVSLHPASNPFTQGLYDYTCPASDSVYQFLGGTPSTPFPIGNIDLRLTPEGYLSDPSDWPYLVGQAMADTLYTPDITAELTYDSQTHSLKAHCVISNFELLLPRLAIWLVEDSLIGVQAMPDGSVSTHYVHRHLLRDAAHDEPLGRYLVDGRDSATFVLPENADPANYSVVAIAIDAQNNYIWNAYETKISTFTPSPAVP